MDEKAPLSDLAEVVSVDQISGTMQAAIGNSQYGPERDEIRPEDWIELEVAPAGSSLEDKDLPFLIAPACEMDAGHQVQLSGALLVTNLAFDDPEESEDPEEFDREVYLATGFEDRGGGFWTLTSPRRGGRISEGNLRYWDDPGKLDVECRCGWSGTAGQLYEEMFKQLHTLHCPVCQTSLFIVPYPSPEETREAAAAGNKMAQGQQATDELRAMFLEKASEAEIASPDELADIDGEGEIRIDWDFEETERDKWVVLRHEGEEIGREIAYFEGIGRFRTIFKLLIEKYGDRFAALTPSEDSKLYLFGDDLGASDVVRHLNRERASQLE